MSNKISRKHHYIPQFYLRGFYEGDSFVVYDKKFGKFISKSLSSSMIMFELDRNTTMLNGSKTDFIEKGYSVLESNFAKLFQIARSENEAYTLLSPEGITLFRQYILIQLCRLPALDPFIDNILMNMDLKKAPSPILINGKPLGEIEEYSNLLATNKHFRYYYRCFFLPLIINPKLWFNTDVSAEELKHWRIGYVEDESQWSNHIIGDLPFAFKGIDNLIRFDDDFIFPISRSRLLIRFKNENAPHKISPTLSSKLSCLMFGQSQRYVLGPDKEYIENIIKLYERWWGDSAMESLKLEVFENLYKE